MKNTLYSLSFLCLTVLFVGCSLNDQSNFVSFENDAFNAPDVSFQENYKDHGENPFINTNDAPISTFSVDADGASYANMRRFLNLGQTPPAASVRIEEYINYFTFDYAEPENGDHVALNSEVAICPWNTEHHLMRIGMKGKSIPENELPNSNYVFLIDVSGSMNSPDKLGVLKTGFKTLTDNLKNDDKIAIVTYAGSAGILLPSTSGTEKEKIKQAIDKLGAGGATAGAEGIITAYKIAEENFITDGNNRVILGSDGDFNVGPASTEDLVKLIEEKRDNGIYLTVLGVGGGNLNDHGMEQIANKGNGNYEYIDNAKQIQKVFTYELGKLYTVAKDSKIQITFNEKKVSSYRLIGYENRALENEDFEDDKKDAGEIGASQTITALYEIVLTDNSIEESFAKFDFRYKKPNSSESIPLTHQVEGNTYDMNTSSENMRFSAAVAGFGLLIKDSQYKSNVSKEMVVGLANTAKTFDPHGFRKEFIELISNWTK